MPSVVLPSQLMMRISDDAVEEYREFTHCVCAAAYWSSQRFYVVLCVLVSITSSVLLGYDIGIMSAAKLPIRTTYKLSDGQTEVLVRYSRDCQCDIDQVGILNVIAAFGGLFSGKLADRYGRKKTIGAACTTFVVGATVMAASNSFNALLAGRIITGLGVSGCICAYMPVI